MQKITTLVICLILVTGIAVGNKSDILCVGNDGHIKVESICQPCCNESYDYCQISEPGNDVDHHDGCYDCLDYLLERHTWRRQKSEYVSSVNPLELKPLLTISYIDDKVVTDCSFYIARNNLSQYNNFDSLITSTVLIC